MPVYALSAASSLSGRASLRTSRSVAPSARRQNTPASRGRLQVCAAKIAVIGGSGGTGSECVFQALEAGDEVITLVRTPSKVRLATRRSPAARLGLTDWNRTGS